MHPIRPSAADKPVTALPTRLLPWAILLFTGVLWGVSFSLAKMAVDAGGKPFAIAFWQAVVSGGLLLFYVLLRHRGIGFRRKHLGLIITIAALGSAIPGVFFYFAASKVPVGVLAITVTLVPILTYLLAVPMQREKFSFIRLAGVLFGIVAILLLLVPENSLPDRAALPWVMLACLSSVCYAIENLVIDRWQIPGLGPIRLSCGMSLMAAMLLLPVVFGTDQFALPQLPFGQLEWSIIGLGVLTATAYTLFIYLVNTAGPLFASQTGYVVTLAGVFWGMALFSESHSNWVWASLGTMLLGLALVTPRKRAGE